MKPKIFAFMTTALGAASFLLTGCVVSTGDEPCSSGEYQCSETNTLQLCKEEEWTLFTDCPKINHTCAIIGSVPQCVPQNKDTGKDSGEDSDSNTAVSSDESADTQTSDNSTDETIDTATADTTDTNTTAETGADTASDTSTMADSDTPTETEENTNPAACQTPIRLGVLGSMDSTANGANIASFFEWLTSNSDLEISFITSRSTLDADFLANYDVLMLLLQSDSANTGWWQYDAHDATESSALATWINAGGGVIGTAGYTPSFEKETHAINSLLGPGAGLTYNGDSATFSTCSGEECGCWQNAVPVENWDTAHPIAKNVTKIGALYGFKIVSTANASIVATDENGDPAIAAVESGAGRVVAIGDEWPLFANMWLDNSDMDTDTLMEPDTYHSCYDTENNRIKTVANSFQHSQFWYNVINWVAPAGYCMSLQDAAITP